MGQSKHHVQHVPNAVTLGDVVIKPTFTLLHSRPNPNIHGGVAWFKKHYAY